MLLIYRVEHPETGKGPWMHRGDSWEDEIVDQFNIEWEQFNSLESHPSPYMDGIQGFQMGFDVLGVTSIDQLKDWLGKGDIPKMLHHAGFVIRIYGVEDEDVKDGYTQVAFWAKQDCILEEMNVTELA